jgi:hypothetical protein
MLEKFTNYIKNLKVKKLNRKKNNKETYNKSKL